MEVFVVLGYDSVRRERAIDEKLAGIRVATSRFEAEAIAASEWGQEFTYTEIEKRHLEGV